MRANDAEADGAGDEARHPLVGKICKVVRGYQCVLPAGLFQRVVDIRGATVCLQPLAALHWDEEKATGVFAPSDDAYWVFVGNVAYLVPVPGARESGGAEN